MTNIETLKYPIGKYIKEDSIPKNMLECGIKNIEAFPDIVKQLIKDVSPELLNWKYRPNGWTIKQVIHHCADSHMNSIIRFKLALTEDTPTIKPYQEEKWAELPDSLSDDLSDVLLLLKGLHKKWAFLLSNLTDEQLQRTYFHPSNNTTYTLAQTIMLYDWHCRHHLEHIKNGLASQGKYS